MRQLLSPAAKLYGWGARQHREAYRRGWLKTERLGRPAISVGNLTVGGSGKTPLVRLIAEALLRQGYRPSILTRGYRRESGTDLLVITPGENRQPDPRRTGDEPAWLARNLPQVPVMISADRYRAGQAAEKQFGVDVHILDDGFQHYRLARDLDLVAIDATQEFIGGSLLPEGRLREPVSAIERADVIVLTRCELQDTAALDNEIRRLNRTTPIFHCNTAFCGVMRAGEAAPLPVDFNLGTPLHAFCGTGNSGSFFLDLRRWGFALSSEVTFRDHHVYSEKDLERLLESAERRGAKGLITTEKDAINLPSQRSSRIPIFVCLTEARIQEFEYFEERLLAIMPPGCRQVSGTSKVQSG